MFRRVRQNHALEHGTVSLILQRGTGPPLGGYSTGEGFFIFGRATTDLVVQAVADALRELKRGQRELAVSPHCGTNLVTGPLLAGLASAIILGRGKERFGRIPSAAAAIICTTLLSRPLGNELQRRYTTLADVEDMDITDVRRLWASPGGSYTLHRIKTTTSAS